MSQSTPPKIIDATKLDATAPTADAAEFDSYADDYDGALQQGLSVSGESKEYFAQGRVTWLAASLRRLGVQPRKVMDFGCGTGASTPYLLDTIGAESVLGVDVSKSLLRVAERTFGSERARFAAISDYTSEDEIDLVFCNGVFHHIPPPERAEAIAFIMRALRPGGLFAFWENNPWNPGTRYIMSKIPFDRDAITLTPPEARRLVQTGGMEVLRTDFLFLFPNALKSLRGLEPLVASLPLGAQYQILCRKP
ncbi:MAG: trans-aconitate 2-methyltransferase [Chthonomonadaceae bacterium]|nr:trans-aconitate 2-methyltransferase [Chthonomonadaceae bacterium]